MFIWDINYSLKIVVFSIIQYSYSRVETVGKPDSDANVLTIRTTIFQK